MSIDFSKLKELTIPEGVVVQVADLFGNVLWKQKPEGMCTVTIMSSVGGPPISMCPTIDDELYVTIDEQKYVVQETYMDTTGSNTIASAHIATISVPYGTTIHCYNSRNDIQVNGVSVGSVTEYDYIVNKDTVIYFIGVGSSSSSITNLVYGAIYINEIPEGSVVLCVDKITSDTYAGETTYTGEQFILLDIYPKTNGTVTVTYGGLAKTITDTSGAESPNAQQVVFGTFNGVSDSVATPVSGTLTIEGDYYAFACGSYASAKASTDYCACIADVANFGAIVEITAEAFHGCTKLTKVIIPNTVTEIGGSAFNGCFGLTQVVIPSSVVTIGSSYSLISNSNSFANCNISCPVEIDINNPYYKVDGKCIIRNSVSTDEFATFGKPNYVVSGFLDTVIPSYAKGIAATAFYGMDIENITIPENVIEIGAFAFGYCERLINVTVLATIPPSFSGSGSVFSGDKALTTITVPKGCGDAYKAAEGWSEYADYIVEAS